MRADSPRDWASILVAEGDIPDRSLPGNTQVNGYPLAVADPPTHWYNARAGYTIKNLDLSLFVSNVFNSTPALSKYQANGGSNLITYTTFAPRTIGVTANYSFR